MLVVIAFWSTGVYQCVGRDVSAADAKDHIGEKITVRGEIIYVGFTGSGAVFLDMGGRLEKPRLTIVSPNIPYFSLSEYKGKIIRISGRIEGDRRNARMTLTDLSQINN